MKNVLTTVTPNALFLGHAVIMTVLDKNISPEAARFDSVGKIPHFATSIHDNATGDAYHVLVHLTRTEGAAELRPVFQHDAGSTLVARFGVHGDVGVPAGLHEFIAREIQGFLAELGGLHALAPSVLTYTFASGLQRMNWKPISAEDDLIVSVATRRNAETVHYTTYAIERRLVRGQSGDTGRPDYRVDHIEITPLEAEQDDVGFYNSGSRAAYRFGGFNNTRRLLLVNEAGHKYHVVNSQGEGLFRFITEEAEISYIEKLVTALLPELQGYRAVFEEVQPVQSLFVRPNRGGQY